MNKVENKSDTNHKMNFIIGFIASSVIGIIWMASFNIEVIIRDWLYILQFTIPIFGIPGGITGIIVGLAIDFKKYKFKTNMIVGGFVGGFVGGIIGLIIAPISISTTGFDITIPFFVTAIIVGVSVVLRTSTQVKDSLVQRSNIGTDVKKCSNCSRDVDSNEKFCLECGTKIE